MIEKMRIEGECDDGCGYFEADYDLYFEIPSLDFDLIAAISKVIAEFSRSNAGEDLFRKYGYSLDSLTAYQLMFVLETGSIPEDLFKKYGFCYITPDKEICLRSWQRPFKLGSTEVQEI